MRLSRPAQVLLSVGLVAVGFLGPWQLGFTHTPDQPQVQPSEPPVERVAVWMVPTLEDTPELADAAPLQPTDAPDAPDTSAPQEVVEPEPADTVEPAKGRADGLQLVALAQVGTGVLGARDGVVAGTGERSARPPRRPRDTRPRKRSCEPDRTDVAEVTETSFRVEAALVDYYADHPREAEELAATWWSNDEGGDHRGFKVGRVGCGSLLHQIGFRSGDVILSVNGFEIQSYREAVTAFLQLRQKDVLWVDVDRKGDPIRLDYHLVADGTAEDTPEVDPTALVDDAIANPDWLVRVDQRRDQRELRRDARTDRRDERGDTRDQRREDREGRRESRRDAQAANE
jgi:hypothetical protein